MKRLILIAGLLLAAANAAIAQPAGPRDAGTKGFITERFDRIDVAIEAEVAAGKIPGAVALVARNGEIAYFKSFGFADLEAPVPMRNDHVFRIASMSKAITSVAAMMLYERGSFQLNDALSKYIPAFSAMRVVDGVDEDGNITSTVAAKNPIKIIDLLTHTAGIGYPFIASSVQKTYVDAGVIDGITERNLTLAAQMELLAAQPLMFEPGSDWAYGLGTDVLGYLVEVVSGKPLDRFFEEEIFTPLGMRDTHFYLPADQADRLVTLYAHVDGAGLVVSRGNESDIVLDNPRFPVEGAKTYFSGGCGLSSTAFDYARFIQMLLNDGELDGHRILGRKSVELMRTARADIDGDGTADFGLGFFVAGDPGSMGELGSTGAYRWGGAFNTAYWIDPAENLIAVIMTQVRPQRSDITDRFRTLVYQALE